MQVHPGTPSGTPGESTSPITVVLSLDEGTYQAVADRSGREGRRVAQQIVAMLRDIMGL
jgi:hypothetical protein